MKPALLERELRGSRPKREQEPARSLAPEGRSAVALGARPVHRSWQDKVPARSAEVARFIPCRKDRGCAALVRLAFTSPSRCAPAGRQGMWRRPLAGRFINSSKLYRPVATAITDRKLAWAASMSRGVSPTTQMVAWRPCEFACFVRSMSHQFRADREMVAEATEPEPLRKPACSTLIQPIISRLPVATPSRAPRSAR